MTERDDVRWEFDSRGEYRGVTVKGEARTLLNVTTATTLLEMLRSGYDITIVTEEAKRVVWEALKMYREMMLVEVRDDD